MTQIPEQPTPALEPEPLTFPDVVRAVFSGPRVFATYAARYFIRPAPPSFYIVVWLLGMDGVAAAMELEFFTTGHHLVDNWFYAWLRIMFAGVGAGVIRYWLAGTVFHGVVLLSRGHGTARTSRYIFLYAVLPVVLVELAVKVAQMLVYGNGYFTGASNPSFDAFAGGAMAAAFMYSAVLCYTGMRTVQGTDRGRSLAVLVGVAVITVFFGIALIAQGGGH